MIEAILDWIAEHLGEPRRYGFYVSYEEEDFSFEHAGRAEISSYDALACKICQGNNYANDTPSGKQVI